MSDLLDFVADAPCNIHDTRGRIDTLVKTIRYHRDLYYNRDPEISDEEFDAYVDELRAIDPKHPILSEVGAPVLSTTFETVKHQIPMGSLDKVNTETEMSDWWLHRISGANIPTGIDIDQEGLVEEKLDGASLAVYFKDGKLTQAITRGGGTEGEDITRNVLRMKTPKTLGQPLTGHLRCEIMFMEEDFQAYNKEAAEKGWTTFKNKRNGAAGLSRRTSGEGCEYLTLLYYDIYPFDSTKTEYDKMLYLEYMLKVPVPFYKKVSLSELILFYKEYGDSIRNRLSYDIDGLVIKSLSSTSGNQVAWKFASETRVTTLLSVSADFGLGGRITPVAEIAPVDIGGVTINRASLHNWDMVSDMGLKAGCKVLIARNNDVIPQIVRRLDDEGDYIFPPTVCTKCQSNLSKVGKYLSCDNRACPGVVAGSIRKWILELEIDYFGTSMIDALVASKHLTKITDLYTIQEADIAPVVGKGMAKRALQNLHAHKDIYLYTMLGAMSIPLLGTSLSKRLYDEGYDTLDKILNASIAQLAKVDGFGVERSTQVWRELKILDPLLRELTQYVTLKSAVKITGTLTEKSFCITGSLSKPKAYFQEKIEALGGTYVDSLSKGVTYLIAADKTGTSAKLEKARKYGTTVIDESDLLGML